MKTDSPNPNPEHQESENRPPAMPPKAPDIGDILAEIDALLRAPHPGKAPPFPRRVKKMSHHELMAVVAYATLYHRERPDGDDGLKINEFLSPTRLLTLYPKKTCIGTTVGYCGLGLARDGSRRILIDRHNRERAAQFLGKFRHATAKVAAMIPGLAEGDDILDFFVRVKSMKAPEPPTAK